MNFIEMTEKGIEDVVRKTVRKRLGIDWISISIILLFIGKCIFKQYFESLFDDYGWIIEIIFVFNIGVRLERERWIKKEEINKYFKGEYNRSTS